MRRVARSARPFGTGQGAPASFLIAFLLLLGLLASCSSEPIGGDGAIMDVDADSAIVHGAAAHARTSPEGKPYQYRAVCLEASRHPQPVYLLSKWVEDESVAWDLGSYHGSHKAKGHHWVIQRRVQH